jgi:hypothetical protein
MQVVMREINSVWSLPDLYRLPKTGVVSIKSGKAGLAVTEFPTFTWLNLLIVLSNSKVGKAKRKGECGY